ncbi:MAG: carboxypeptidase-like regulatory domain-containing protein [Bacteroidales bacterium]|nr:carboxypeptidase-like regulatory domain-containing protein [Bacteroidales bacterium]
MTNGKNICNQLKEVRKRIAEENHIPMKIEECTYKGECRGTCPRCEAEVRYLENALADRLRVGKVATVAGLALGLAATNAAEASPAVLPEVPTAVREAVHKDDRVKIKGEVVDAKTAEPIPFVYITVIDSNKDTVMVTYTDFDGLYHIEVPKGDYTLEFKTVGYYKYVLLEDHYVKDRTLPTVKLETSAMVLGMVIIGDEHPVIEIGPDGGMNTEVEGVQVKVR